MPNYAYNPRRTGAGAGGGSFGFSANPFSSWLQGLSSPQREIVDAQYMLNPNLALQQLIDKTRPSNTNEELLRKMLPMLRDRWSNEQLLSDNPYGARTFTDFLAGTNFDREFGRINPGARKDRSSYFNRPVRTISF